MDWSKGYSARYYASIVDRSTMRDLGISRLNLNDLNRNTSRIEITGGSIKRTITDLRQSASLDCVNYEDTGEQFIRVWLDARQEGESSHTPLFTGLATSPKKTYNGRMISNTVECFSVLKIADDILLDPGWYAPLDVDGPMLVRDLLSVIGVEIVINPITSETRTLSQNILAESGETNLSMANTILATIGWDMRIDGYGTIYLDPIARDPIATFDSIGYDIIEPSLDVEYDWYECPNVLRVITGGVSAVARDDHEDSPLSTVNRGREVWKQETDANLNDGETVAEYARRRLSELQNVYKNVSYDRRYDPDIYPMDVVQLNYPAQDLVGYFRIESQSIELGYNAKTSEEVFQI